VIVVSILFNNKDKANPTHASINNGTLLCDTCAGMHKAFGDQISYLRSLSDFEWNQTCYLYIELGGNENFRKFMEKYGLLEEPIAIRYMSHAAAYYRMQV